MSQGFAVDMLGFKQLNKLHSHKKAPHALLLYIIKSFWGYGELETVHGNETKKKLNLNKVYDSLSWDKSMVPCILRFPYQRLFGSIAEISVL
jgi:hypothetical protein